MAVLSIESEESTEGAKEESESWAMKRQVGLGFFHLELESYGLIG